MKALIAAAMLLWASTASAQIVFYDNCEDYPNIGVDWLEVGLNDQSILQASADHARSGSKSYKFVLPPYGTDGTDSNSKRTELRLVGTGSPVNISNWVYGQEYWVGYSVFIPADFVWPGEVAGDWGLSGQWHSVPDACEATVILNPTAAFYFQRPSHVGFAVQGYTAACSTSTKDRNVRYDGLPLVKGQWNDVIMNFRFHYDSNANPAPFWKVWINGTRVVNDTGKNCWNDAKGPFYKIGLYGIQRQWLTIYYDEIRVGINSSYNEVAPSAIAPPAITTAAIGTLTEGSTTTGTMAASGGVLPYTWTCINKPVWFSIASATGAWSATPPTDGQYSLTIVCTDADNNAAQKDYSGVIIDTTPPVSEHIKLSFTTDGGKIIKSTGTKTITIQP